MRVRLCLYLYVGECVYVLALAYDGSIGRASTLAAEAAAPNAARPHPSSSARLGLAGFAWVRLSSLEFGVGVAVGGLLSQAHQAI